MPPAAGSAVSQPTSVVACAVAPCGVTVTDGTAAMPVSASNAVTTMVSAPTAAGSGLTETISTTCAVVSTVKPTEVTGLWMLPASSAARTSSRKVPSPHCASSGPLVTSQVVLTAPGLASAVVSVKPLSTGAKAAPFQ